MLNQLTTDVVNAPFGYQKAVFSSFFRPPNTSRREREDMKRNGGAPIPVARAVMVDMEPKVIYQTTADAKATGRDDERPLTHTPLVHSFIDSFLYFHLLIHSS